MAQAAGNACSSGWLRLASVYFAICCSVMAIGGCKPGSPPTATLGTSSNNPRDLLTLADTEVNADGEVLAIRIFGADVSDAELGQLGDFEHLESLSLQECAVITDDAMTAAGEHPRLRTLSLINVPISDAGLANLGRSNSLDKLLLGQTRVIGAGLGSLATTPISTLTIHSRVATADGLAAIPKLTSLRVLELHCPQVKIADLPSFRPLIQLVSLVATRTPLGTTGLERFRGHAGLKRLMLNADGLGDGTLAILNTLTELEELELAGAKLTDEGLRQLAMPKLRTLSLVGCAGVTDLGLKNLAGLSGLEELDLTEAGVAGRDLTGLHSIKTLRTVIMSGGQFKGNDASLKALKALLPACEIRILRG